MQFKLIPKKVSLFGYLLTTIIVVTQCANSAEPASEFLEKLRQEKLFELADHYLETTGKSDLVADEFRQQLDYEIGLTVLQAATRISGREARLEQFNRASEHLTRFAANANNSDLKIKSNQALGTLEQTLASAAIKHSQTNAGKQNLAALMDEAKGHFAKALESYIAVRTEIEAQLKDIPKILDPKTEQPLIERRDELRTSYLKTYITLGLIQEEAASAHEEGSETYVAELEKALEIYREIEEKYRSLQAGQFALTYQGRCLQKIGKHPDALTYFDQALASDPDTFRTVHTHTLVYAIQTWLELSKLDDQNHLELAATSGFNQIDSMRNDEIARDGWMQLQVEASRALIAHADSVNDADAKLARTQYIRARRILLEFMKLPTPFRDDAQELLAKLPGLLDSEVDEAEPVNFVEARDRAKRAFDEMSAAEEKTKLLAKFQNDFGAEFSMDDLNAAIGSVEVTQQLESFATATATTIKDNDQSRLDLLNERGVLTDQVQPQIAAINDGTNPAEVVTAILGEAGSEKLTYNIIAFNTSEAVINKRLEAKRYYAMALDFAGVESTIDQLQGIYYYLCFLEYRDGNLYESAMYGEYLARNYPNTPAAEACTGICLSVFQTLYANSLPDDRDFERDRIIGIGQFAIQTWPNGKVANDARRKLISYMLEDKRYQDAKQLALEIPEGSELRVECEMRLGRSMWFRYRVLDYQLRKKITAGGTNAETDTERDQLDQMRTEAGQFLISAFKYLPEDSEIDRYTVEGSLAISQYFVDIGNMPEAKTSLEHPRYGMVTLVKAGHPHASTAKVVEDTYSMALSANIGSLATATAEQTNAIIAASREIMTALNEAVSGQEGGQRRLVSRYYTLARQLERQLKEAESTEQKQALASGFETFLNEVGNTATDFSTQHWLGETFKGLGSGFEGADGSVSAVAKKYYEKSIQQFESILQKGTEDPKWVNEQDRLSKGYLLQVNSRIAELKSKLGSYSDALNSFSQILQVNEMRLDIQVAAANVYMQWGSQLQVTDKTNASKQFVAAIGGGFPKADEVTGNIVWGWKKIAKLTQGNAKFREEFFEARYNLALARYQYAKLRTSEKPKYLGYAEQEIKNTQLIVKDLGNWKPRFEALLKQVQKDLKKPQVGFGD